MRKFQILVLSLFAVSALGAVLVASASAEETLLASWLVNGVAITEGANLAVEVPGEILLEDNNVGGAKVAVLCSGILDGTVGFNGADLIESVLSLEGVLIEQELLGTGLLCSSETTCEAASETSPIEVWPELLPWPTLIFLMATTGEILLLIENAHYEVLCLVLGIMVEDLCESADSEVLVLNEPGAEIPAGQAGLPFGNCTRSSLIETGVNETDILAPINLVGGGELTVSSE